MDRLDRGEREAILLAEQLAADLVVLDDKTARRIALVCGLRIIGLLGILKDAASAGLIDLAATFERLRAVGFWVAPTLLQRLRNSNESCHFRAMTGESQRWGIASCRP